MESIDEDLEEHFALDDNFKVIAHGKNLSKVINEARRMGIECPTLIYVPNPNISDIY